MGIHNSEYMISALTLRINLSSISPPQEPHLGIVAERIYLFKTRDNQMRWLHIYMDKDKFWNNYETKTPFVKI